MNRWLAKLRAIVALCQLAQRHGGELGERCTCSAHELAAHDPFRRRTPWRPQRIETPCPS